MQDGSVVIRIEADDAPLRAALTAAEGLARAAAEGADAAARSAGDALARAAGTGAALASAAPGMVEALAASIEAAGSARLPASGAALTAALRAGALSRAPELASAGAALAQRGAEGALTAKGAFTASGAALADGLWQGVSSRTDWLHGQLSAWAAGLAGSVRAALGIHSPSTVMAAVGRNLALGLGRGWEEAAPAVLERIERDAAALPDALIALQPLQAAGTVQSAGLAASAAERWSLAAAEQASRRTAYAEGAAHAPAVQTSVEFQGSLAQLGRVLRPVLKTEQQRAGGALTDGRE